MPTTVCAGHGVRPVGGGHLQRGDRQDAHGHGRQRIRRPRRSWSYGVNFITTIIIILLTIINVLVNIILVIFIVIIMTIKITTVIVITITNIISITMITGLVDLCTAVKRDLATKQGQQQLQFATVLKIVILLSLLHALSFPPPPLSLHQLHSIITATTFAIIISHVSGKAQITIHVIPPVGESAAFPVVGYEGMSLQEVALYSGLS
jgi:hypothetical protein